ncbi:MAG: lytic murein transglycosylase [Patescibacteria group bacterium]
MRDISSPESGKRVGERINLSPRRGFSVAAPFALLQILILCAILTSLFFGNATAPTASTLAANSPQEERAGLEKQLQELESQIDQYQDQIKQYEKQGKTLKGEVDKLNAQISKLNLQIKSVNITLKDLDGKIVSTETKIGETQENITLKEDALSELIRQIQQAEADTFLEILLKNPTLSDFFDHVNNLSLVQGGLRTTILQIKDLQQALEEDKEELTLARADAEAAKSFRESQRQETDRTKSEKNNLLVVTKGQESKYQALLQKTKANAAQIRSRLFEFLGGGELSFEDAYRFAKIAGDATGVRPAFILAILDRESALGQNVGRCKYNEIFPSTGKPAMHPTRDVPAFLKIVSALGLQPDSVTVSCPNRDGTYGGAMGPAQFIPSTWAGYADDVASVTGRSPASPWNNGDAFVAAGLYLRDAGASTNERNAAARYYCGTRWNRSVCTNVYGAKVVERASKFQEDINIING